MASFQGYFNYDFHVFGRTIADLDAVSVEDLVGGGGFEENAFQVDLKNICRFLWIHFYWKVD